MYYAAALHLPLPENHLFPSVMRLRVTLRETDLLQQLDKKYFLSN